MNFSEKLEQYLDELNITAKQLAEESGISASVISRYKSGERMPNKSSVIAISNALEKIYREKGIDSIKNENITSTLLQISNLQQYSTNTAIRNFNLLIDRLEIRINSLAKATNYDSSYISRIRSGKRVPKNLNSFFDNILKYISTKYIDKESILNLSDLIQCEPNEISNSFDCFEKLKLWLFSENETADNDVNGFLKKLDEFNLNDYIRSIHFDTLKVPKAPFILPTSKNYYSLEEMKQAELDFLKATVLSKSNDRVFMYSEMQMDDMAKDIDFSKKWMFGIALMLKKGLQLDMIHNLDRPFHEMMLGLESWMPIYMTGQITPYYIKSKNTSIFNCLNYCSGAAALYGECIVGHHRDGKYYLSKSQSEIKYYRKKADFILQKAHPLMDIYDVSKKESYASFMLENSLLDTERNNIFTIPPLYTLEDEVLEQILNNNNVSLQEKEEIRNEVIKSREAIEKITENNNVTDRIKLISEEEFENMCPNISLSSLFYEKDIKYTYELYKKHIESTLQYSKTNKNYFVIFDEQKGFNNIEISVLKDKLIVISKNKAPAIHFVIRHPRLCKAISNLVIPVIEE